MEKEKEDLEKGKIQWKEKSEKYRDKATEMQDLVTKISVGSSWIKENLRCFFNKWVNWKLNFVFFYFEVLTGW